MLEKFMEVVKYMAEVVLLFNESVGSYSASLVLGKDRALLAFARLRVVHLAPLVRGSLVNVLLFLANEVIDLLYAFGNCVL